MKHTSIISMKYLLSALAITLFLLLSCGVRESTSPGGENSPGKSTSKYMSFALSNDGRPVDTTTELDRAKNYVLTVKRESGAPLLTADYNFAVTPPGAITTDNTRSSSNKIDFIVNNTDATKITITATHKSNPVISNALELQLAPRANSMSFALSNDGRPVDTTTALDRAKNYVLTVKRESGAPLLTADYTITVTPAGAITTNNTRSSSNKIDFIVNNTDATKITITATHKDNSVITKTLVLKLAPQVADFMSFAISDSDGASVTPSTTLFEDKNYLVTVKREKDAPLLTENYDITIIPPGAITKNNTRSSSNKIEFTVKDANAGPITITATHKSNPVITKSLELNLAPPEGFMSFILSDSGGTVDTTSPLDKAKNYMLTIKRGSAATLKTANYDINVTPLGAITINLTRSNSIAFTVNDTDARSVTITATHKDNPDITGTLVLNLNTFQQDIENATKVPNLDNANALTREVLGPLGVPAGTPLVKRYVTEAGTGSQDGSSWANAWASTNLRNNINAINDASANKVYLIMIAGGTYKPSTSRDDSFSMKNYVAIMGGFQAGGGWERSGTTVFSGEIGTDANIDNTHTIFRHIDIPLNNAHLYGITITGGYKSDDIYTLSGGGMVNDRSSPVLTRIVFINNHGGIGGGGMVNEQSSPLINNTVFINNTGNVGGGVVNNGSSPVFKNTEFSGNISVGNGGGMYNKNSSPNLTQVVFSGNISRRNGGGMFNEQSSPVVNNTVFISNVAENQQGGGVYNSSSSPIFNNTVFIGNSTANTSYGMGGGMYNQSSSSPVIIGAVFRGNKARFGGGMRVQGGNVLIANTIFSDNAVYETGLGPAIGASSDSVFRIAGSVFGDAGLAQPTNAIVGWVDILHYQLAKGNVNFGADATTGRLTYPTIGAGSSAINRGLHIRRSGTTYYFSEDNATWYSGFTTTGAFDGSLVTLPANVEDLTTRDIAGKTRTGRPDAGVFELP